ncbi:hypothetical protein V5799_000344 [Amblyomma americanum]|uniref:Secreted protein n=1 Tax=Amblyomma americanum TaxID=6943 RepID=A0AAQ4D3B4_AMBAM
MRLRLGKRLCNFALSAVLLPAIRYDIACPSPLRTKWPVWNILRTVVPVKRAFPRRDPADQLSHRASPDISPTAFLFLRPSAHTSHSASGTSPFERTGATDPVYTSAASCRCRVESEVSFSSRLALHVFS